MSIAALINREEVLCAFRNEKGLGISFKNKDSVTMLFETDLEAAEAIHELSKPDGRVLFYPERIIE